ncbi:hypothetical protein EJ02DRAFT_432753 [Clathrospora elynae]|uniref:Uncharacterized protein n=1 Tax=Clathrospora elynae TaxID=706981 RepID=A0A6A5SXB6_9PLEO|nr:hypothetical protein EJ02DRAFT_432753 [Clathrospora elynae]
MSSLSRSHNHEARSREVLRDTQSSTLHPSRAWYHHPVVVFIVPLVALLYLPRLYSSLIPHSLYSPLYNDMQLQEIATLMDDLYTLLADMTFIPHTSIKRGPHQINATANTCKRDPAALRLMEILPYVDASQVQESDFLFGGSFMDYRRNDKLREGCDPFHTSASWDYMTPETVALTSWGTGGWNGDRTWVLMYDTGKHAMRVYEGELWIAQTKKSQLTGEDISGVGIFREGIQAGRSILDRSHHAWAEWFDAPKLLTRLKEAYRTAAWSPWETSNRDHGWGVDRKHITSLLRKNGWPETFDPDQFNVDFIRAQNKPSGRGWAEAVFKTIEDLEGEGQTDLGLTIDGQIAWGKERLRQLIPHFEKATDPEERWLLMWRVQRAKRDVERDEAHLEAAKQEVQWLCPNGTCVEEEDMILWEFRAVEKEYAKALVAGTATSKCQKQMDTLPAWAPSDPDRFDNCVAQIEQQERWLLLAYEQTKAEALEHCAKTKKFLLPSDTLEDRAKVRIATLQLRNTRHKETIQELLAWGKDVDIPEYGIKVTREWELANGPWFLENEIDKIEERLADGGDKESLWRYLDSGDGFPEEEFSTVLNTDQELDDMDYLMQYFLVRTRFPGDFAIVDAHTVASIAGPTPVATDEPPYSEFDHRIRRSASLPISSSGTELLMVSCLLRIRLEDEIRDTELAELRGYARRSEHGNITVVAEMLGEKSKLWEFGVELQSVTRHRTPATEFWPNTHFDPGRYDFSKRGHFKIYYPKHMPLENFDDEALKATQRDRKRRAEWMASLKKRCRIAVFLK